jgi:hypothetical protein
MRRQTQSRIPDSYDLRHKRSHKNLCLKNFYHIEDNTLVLCRLDKSFFAILPDGNVVRNQENKYARNRQLDKKNPLCYSWHVDYLPFLSAP